MTYTRSLQRTMAGDRYHVTQHQSCTTIQLRYGPSGDDFEVCEELELASLQPPVALESSIVAGMPQCLRAV